MSGDPVASPFGGVVGVAQPAFAAAVAAALSLPVPEELAPFGQVTVTETVVGAGGVTTEAELPPPPPPPPPLQPEMTAATAMEAVTYRHFLRDFMALVLLKNICNQSAAGVHAQPGKIM